MALPAYTPEYQAPAERLHYFHPFRVAVAMAVIVAADLGLNIWLGGAQLVSNEARTALLVALLLFMVARTFLPRTLSADATEIRWKQTFQPVRTVDRRDVVAIQYLTTARPGAPRYYFVNRDGTAVLWVDRFMPARMASFASYLGIPMLVVSVAPRTTASADAAVQANAIVGQRRSAMVLMAGCAVVGLAFTVGCVWWGAQSRDRLAAYARAALCTQASADPRACRYLVPAVVTDWTASGRIYLRFSEAVPAFNFRTTFVRLPNGATPDPAFGVGDTVQIEVFDSILLRINGAPTDEYQTQLSNASWLLVVAAAFLFLFMPLLALVVAWKGPASWFASRRTPAAAPKSVLDQPPPVSDQPGPKEKPGAIERVAISDTGADSDEGWPSLVTVPDFDYAHSDENLEATGIPAPGERLLAKAPVHYYGVPGTSSMLLLTDRRLVVLGPSGLEIPRGRITLLAYWTMRDSVAVAYQTMSGPRGILLTGPQLVLTGGPKTDMHRLFEAMQVALNNPDRVRDTFVIARPVSAWSRMTRASRLLTHRLWLAWVG